MATTVVTVIGEVDFCTAPRLDEHLVSAGRTGRRIIVDLEGVEFMDCSGLRVLVGASERLGRMRFAVTLGPPQVQRLFALSGIDTVLDVVPPPTRPGLRAA